MQCPYCKVGIRLDVKSNQTFPAKRDSEFGYQLTFGSCPECEGFVALMHQGVHKFIDGESELVQITRTDRVYPMHIDRISDSRIPERYRKEYNEANSIMFASPKASATLSRRLLQQVIQQEYNIKRQNLEREIDEFIQLTEIPSHIRGAVDAIRHVGNFGAHANKYLNTGEIVDVEPGEADWLLEVLEEILISTFVSKQEEMERKEQLNEKLAALGKSRMKE